MLGGLQPALGAVPSLFSMRILFLLALLAVASPARTVTDHAGRTVEVPERPQRIISLAPGLTETLFAVGAGERVVGVSDYCDFPAEAASRPKIGGIVNPSMEAIVALRPDLVLLTTDGNRRETVEALERLQIPSYAVGATDLPGVFRLVRDVAEVAGVGARGEELAARLGREAAAIEAAVAGRAPRRALFLVWLQPIVSAGRGSFLDDLLRRAGAESISRASTQPWPHLSLEEILRADPEFVLVPRTPWFAPSREELLKMPGWRDLSAIRQSRLVPLPAAVERPGPRLVEVLGQVARALHPGAFAAASPASDDAAAPNPQRDKVGDKGGDGGRGRRKPASGPGGGGRQPTGSRLHGRDK